MSDRPSGEIVLYQSSSGAPALEVHLHEETVWLTQDQMAELFGKAKSTINEHIRNVSADGELVPEQVRRKSGNSEFSTKPTKTDITVAKNYLDAGELKRLNTLVSAYFDAAEFRAQNHKPTYMKGWLGHLDRLIVAMEARILDGAGNVSHQQAITKAETEYAKYQRRLRAEPSDVEAAYLDTVKRVQRRIEGKKP